MCSEISLVQPWCRFENYRFHFGHTRVHFLSNDIGERYWFFLNCLLFVWNPWTVRQSVHILFRQALRARLQCSDWGPSAIYRSITANILQQNDPDHSERARPSGFPYSSAVTITSTATTTCSAPACVSAPVTPSTQWCLYFLLCAATATVSALLPFPLITSAKGKS